MCVCVSALGHPERNQHKTAYPLLLTHTNEPKFTIKKQQNIEGSHNSMQIIVVLLKLSAVSPPNRENKRRLV